MTVDLAHAIEHHRAGRLREAEAEYRTILAAAPDQADGRHLLGVLLLQQGDTAGATAEIERACRIAPDVMAYRISLGNALMAAGRMVEAVTAYTPAAEAEPGNADLQVNLGVALRRCGRAEEAVTSFRRAVEARPDYAEAHYNLGNALQALGRLDPAIQAYSAALTYKPGLVAAYTNLGAALKSHGRLAEAIGCYRRALALSPDNAEASNNLGIVLQALGDQTGAVGCFRQALALKPDFAEAHSNLLFGLGYDWHLSDDALFAEYRNWEACHAVPLYRLARPHGNDRDPERRLRVAYVSADFRDNAIAYTFEGLLSRHDPAAVETFCYMREARVDTVTDRLRRLAAHWRDGAALDDATLAEAIRSDGIDIMALLAGHTGANRPQLCAYRPAPIQVNLFGLSTLGLATVDYWLTDAVLHPADTTERTTETLIRLPNWYVHQPPADAPTVMPPPSASAGYITFGSCNNPAKLTADVVALWSRVLQAVPASRLLLKYLGFFGDDTMRARFAALFARHGIGAERLIFIGDEATRARHLDILSRVDIALDPFPFNGCTASFEALWMGVPVIALAGHRFIGRMGASFLTQIGLTDLIAATPDEYVAKSTSLANDPKQLATLRSSLRTRVAASPLCDFKGYACSVEAAYRDMWRRWCAK